MKTRNGGADDAARPGTREPETAARSYTAGGAPAFYTVEADAVQYRDGAPFAFRYALTRVRRAGGREYAAHIGVRWIVAPKADEAHAFRAFGVSEALNAAAREAVKALPCNYADGRRDALRLRHTTGRVRSRLARCADYWAGWHGARPQYTREHGGVAEDPTRGGGWCMA